MSIDLKELSLMCQSLSLLYVEDNADARKSTLSLLNNFFEDITIAVDGQDALDKFSNKKFDLILSDINMPNLNGIEMLEHIRKDDKNIPIIMLSAYSDSEYFMQAIKLNVDGYILKPLASNQLYEALHKVVQKITLLLINKNYQDHLENEVKKRNKLIEQKLHYDTLTQLYSRYSFFKDIEKLNSPTIVLIDINKFRIINEVYGSDIGSEVLEKFALYLSSSVEDASCHIYRLSSDEFAILSTKNIINSKNYVILVEKLFHRLNNLKLEIDNNTIVIDVTIGLSSVQKNSYESAKIAMEFAKKNKKPYVMYSKEIDDRKESGLTLECRDTISLAIDESRVVPVYQPIVDKDSNIVKYETLMRLKEKDNTKLMSPYYFLDVAIKTRLYDSLSSIIIFKALHVASTTDNVFSINFTYSDIKNSSFIQKIENFLIEHNKVGKQLVFEITENESIESYEEVKSFILRFRKYGVKIAIDDFGTGFSNFEYILEVEPDYLKIDGSLVKDIDTNTRSFTLVEAIVQFSHKLGIKVIAEFVHSKVIFDMLKELHVDEYQGYYFSEPKIEI